MKLVEFRPNSHVITLHIMGEEWEGIVFPYRGGRAMYLVGDLPEVWTYENPVRFWIDFQDWYVDAYMAKFDELSDRVKMFHPFGNNWMMSSRSGPEYPSIQGHIK